MFCFCFAVSGAAERIFTRGTCTCCIHAGMRENVRCTNWQKKKAKKRRLESRGRETKRLCDRKKTSLLIFLVLQHGLARWCVLWVRHDMALYRVLWYYALVLGRHRQQLFLLSEPKTPTACVLLYCCSKCLKYILAGVPQECIVYGR